MRKEVILLSILLLPIVYAAGPTVTNIEHLAPSIVEQGDTNVALMTFTLTTGEAYPSGKWTGSGAFKAATYTGSPYDLSKVALYADNGDASFTAVDTLCGSATTAYLGKYSFKPTLACNLDTGTPKKFYVVVDIANNATIGNAIDLRIDANDLTFVGGTAPATAINPAGQAYVHEIIPDETPPTTTHNAPETWQGASVAVLFTCTDTQSGCDTVQAMLDGVNSTATGNTLSVAVVGDGAHTIEYWSIDNTGNEESHKTITVSIDTQKPTLDGFGLSENAGKQGDIITLSATFEDSPSGLEYSVSPLITWENEPAACDGAFVQTSYSGNAWSGTFTVPAACDGTAKIVIADIQDKAGNKIVQISPSNFTIDNTPPPAPTLISLLNNQLTNDNTPTFNWTTSSSDVDHYLFQLSASASFATLAINESVDDTQYTSTVLADGTYYWRVASVDAVGHTTYSGSHAFILSQKYINIHQIDLSPGDQLVVAEGAQVKITVNESATLFIATMTDTPGVPAGFDDDCGQEYDFSITNPNAVDWSVELRMLYNSSTINGLDENSLEVAWYDTSWETFPSTDVGINTAADYAWATTDTFIHIGCFGNSPTSSGSTRDYSHGYQRTTSTGGSQETTQEIQSSNSEQQETTGTSQQDPAIPDVVPAEEPSEIESLFTGEFIRDSKYKSAFFAGLTLLLIALLVAGMYLYLKKPKKPEYSQF